MFEVGQRVMVITDKGIAYEAAILARAQGDGGAGAYKVAMHGLGPEQLGQWHKASEVFLPEKSGDDDQDFLDSFKKE